MILHLCREVAEETLDHELQYMINLELIAHSYLFLAILDEKVVGEGVEYFWVLPEEPKELMHGICRILRVKLN